jgi:hypothetical protein
VIDTESGRIRSLETNMSNLWGAYIPRSDELIVAGFTISPYIVRDASKVP